MSELSCIRPITGTGSSRNARAMRSSAVPEPRFPVAGRIARPALGILRVGWAPLPIWLSQRTVSTEATPSSLEATGFRIRSRHSANLLEWTRQQPQRRKPLRKTLRIRVKLQYRGKSCDRHLVNAKRAFERIAFDGFNKVGAPHNDPGLRATEKLVSAERHQIGPVCDRLGWGGFVRQSEFPKIHQSAAAEVHDEWDATVVAQLRKVRFGHRCGEAFDRVITGMNLHDEPGLWADASL